MAPPGLTALGAKGSVRDRLTPPGRVEGSALGRYEAPLRWGGMAPFGAPVLYKTFTTGLSPVGKPYNSPAGVGNAPLLVAGATTFPPAGGLYSSLCVSFILPRLRGKSGAAG